ncbi:MAG: hypothetical protein ACLVJH_02170 [Faecalibacterium prausnitzii]
MTMHWEKQLVHPADLISAAPKRINLYGRHPLPFFVVWQGAQMQCGDICVLAQ